MIPSLWEPVSDLALNPKKTYEYSYQGLVNFGLGLPNTAESGARMTCKFKIAGVSGKTFMLQVPKQTVQHMQIINDLWQTHKSSKVIWQCIVCHLSFIHVS